MLRRDDGGSKHFWSTAQCPRRHSSS
jgi:hypothetical protein